MEILKKASDLLKNHKAAKNDNYEKLNSQRHEINKMIVEMSKVGAKETLQGKIILDELLKKRMEIIRGLSQPLSKEGNGKDLRPNIQEGEKNDG